MLRYVPPVLVPEAWPIILPGLLKVQAHSAEPDLPEQLFPSLVRNTAWLYVDYDPGYRGFIILRPEVLGSGRKNMHIWAVYSEGANFWDRFTDIETLARQFEADSITLSSPRKGWLRRMKDFKPIYVVYRKELS